MHQNILEAQITSLTNKLASQDTVAVGLQNEVRIKHSQLGDLNQQLVALKSDYERSSAVLKQREGELELMRSRLEDTIRSETEYRSLLEESRIQKPSVASDTVKLETLQSKIASQAEQIDRQEAELQGLRRGQAEAQQDAAASQTKISALQQENDKLSRKIQDQAGTTKHNTSVLEEMKTNLVGALNKEKNKSRGLEDTVTSLRIQISSGVNETATLKQSQQQLLEEYKQHKRDAEQTLDAERAKAEEKAQAHSAEIKQLQTDLMGLKTEYEAVREKHHYLKAKSAVLEDTIAGLNLKQSNNSEAVVKSTQEMDVRMSELRTENTGLRETTRNLEKQVLEQQFAMRSQHQEDAKKLQDLTQTKSEVDLTVKSQIEELNTLKRELLSKSAEISEVIQDKVQLDNALRASQLENRTLQEEITASKTEISTITQALEIERNNANEALTSLQQQKAKAEHKLKSERAKLLTIRTQVKVEQEDYESRINGLQNVLDTEKHSTSNEISLRQLRTRMEDEIATLKKQMELRAAVNVPDSPVRGMSLRDQS